MKKNLTYVLVAGVCALTGCAAAEPTSPGADVVDPCTHEVVGSKDGASHIAFDDGTSVDLRAVPVTTLSSPPDLGAMCGGRAATGGGAAPGGGVGIRAIPSGRCYSWHDYEATATGYAECVGMSCSNGFVTQSCYFGS
jgi:hypothetical protein